MGERECWAVVRVLTRGDTGRKVCDPTAFTDRNGAGWYALAAPSANRFMVHVRLKPEGAPRQYASAWQRALWENNPDSMRRVAEWEADKARLGQPYVTIFRTPKIEESAS